MECAEETWRVPADVLKLLNAGENVHAARALIDLAPYSPVLAPVLDVCLTVACSTDCLVRGNALLGFGHLSRRFGELPSDPVYALVANGLSDPDAYVRGQAVAAADDLDQR